MISMCNKTLDFPFCGLENEGNITYFQGLLGGASGITQERHLHAVPGTPKALPLFPSGERNQETEGLPG